MTHPSPLEYALAQLKKAGFEKAQCSQTLTERQELNVENGHISLLRSGQNNSLHLVGIIEKRRASLSVNDIRESSIDNAVAQLLQMAKGSEADDAYDIAPMQNADQFQAGPQQADLDAMYESLSDFLTLLRAEYPTIIMSECALEFTKIQNRTINSNGIDFSEVHGQYNGSLLFSAKDEENISSLNYCDFSTFELNRPFHEFGSIERMLNSTVDSLKARTIPEKFSGDLIITPDAADEFIDFLIASICNGSMISQASLYKDKLNQKVASPLLTLKSLPLDPTMPGSYSYTSDGFKADNLTLLDKGVLKSFLLNQYGANKTGLDRAVNEGGCLVVESGESDLESMIESVQEGILLGQLSGGTPADKGDFSGIAKNSFYIKDGKIQYPLLETMITGNMARILENIDAVSKETVDFGSQRYPWLKVGNISIS